MGLQRTVTVKRSNVSFFTVGKTYEIVYWGHGPSKTWVPYVVADNGQTLPVLPYMLEHSHPDPSKRSG